MHSTHSLRPDNHYDQFLSFGENSQGLLEIEKHGIDQYILLLNRNFQAPNKQ